MVALNDFVFLSYSREKDKKKDGIILSDVSKDKPATAIVEAVGPDVKQIKKGDEVIFDPFRPRVLTNVKGKELYVLQEKYIYGKV